MDSITDILARPEAAARQIEQLSAAVKALTEQLAAVTAERDSLLSSLEETKGVITFWSGKADAARAEVARLTALLLRAVSFIPQSSDAEEVWNAVDALRGDTAPAGGEARP